MQTKDILIELLKVSELSQKEFAKKTGIKEPRISEWLHDKSIVRLDRLNEIANELGLIISFSIRKDEG